MQTASRVALPRPREGPPGARIPFRRWRPAYSPAEAVRILGATLLLLTACLAMLATVIWGLILLFFGIDELLTTAGLTNLCMFLSTGLCLLAAFATAGRHQLSRATMWISLFAGIAAIAGGWIVWEYVLELTHDGYWADGPSKPLGLWEFCTITCVPAMMAAILLPEPRRQG